MKYGRKNENGFVLIFLSTLYKCPVDYSRHHGFESFTGFELFLFQRNMAVFRTFVVNHFTPYDGSKDLPEKKRFDMACSIAGILAIISFCVFIYFWNLLPNTFGTVTDKKLKSRKLLSFSWHLAVVSEKKSF